VNLVGPAPPAFLQEEVFQEWMPLSNSRDDVAGRMAARCPVVEAVPRNVSAPAAKHADVASQRETPPPQSSPPQQVARFASKWTPLPVRQAATRRPTRPHALFSAGRAAPRRADQRSGSSRQSRSQLASRSVDSVTRASV